MLWHMLVVCSFAAIVSGRSTSDSLLVNIEQGPVKGYKPSQGGLYVFYNIPYATAPTGTERFRPPLPPPTWTEPFEAVQSKIVMCPQGMPNWNANQENRIQMQEDCLIANVYVPDTDEKNLPVIVYVHGGAYQLGHGTDMEATTLVKTRNIIAVSFNYRLGAHGLLCLGTKGIPGNAGMKDQVALLRWVQSNIAQFGGNPNDVTIDGWSAGASSVDLIMLSKMARGLFHKVIPESGSNTASFSVQVDPLANARNVAKELRFNDIDNIDALENFFLNAPIDSLWSVNVFTSKNSSVVFSPCIERDIGEEMFLDDHPVNILKSGDYPKVPMLYGISEMEGIFRVGFFGLWRNAMNEKFSDFFPEDLEFEDENERNEVASKVKQFYFGNEPVGENNILSYVDYFTDVMFGYGTARAVQLQVEAGNNQIYLYIYGFADESEDYILHTNVRGATHCAQTNAVMDQGDESKLSAENQKIKAVMRDLWGTFIKTGKPVPEGSEYPAWPAVGVNRAPYMYLNSKLELRGSFLGSRATFWDDIYSKHFRMPVPPTH
ncbi:esterase FE4 [Bicyclus anynana]|uniref:Carboxylic ester hydrolase n=1 Tax=Bicyclus anynana TaxID=110368 RepID=A0A6J1NBH1_BICAN|nr:esterase FE4 [Bicyclus anynana]